MMYKATTDSGKTFNIVFKQDGIMVNEHSFDADIVPINTNDFHVLHEGRSCIAEVLAVDRKAKTVSVRVNHQRYEIKLHDALDEVLHAMGMDKSAVRKVNELCAPMPGLVLDIKVKVGDTLQSGDTVLVLEAMKMENALKMPGEGKVKKILVNKSDAVEKGQLLVEFE